MPRAPEKQWTGTKTRKIVPEASEKQWAGTKTNRNMPACAKVGTLGQHIVPGAPEKKRTGTKTNRNVPACTKVGTLRQQIVPEASEKQRTGTKTNRNVPASHLLSTPGTLCVDRREQFPLRIHKRYLVCGQKPPPSNREPPSNRDLPATDRPPIVAASTTGINYFFRVNTNLNPPPALLVTEILPPWNWTACFTMERPSPVPPIRRDRPLSIL